MAPAIASDAAAYESAFGSSGSATGKFSGPAGVAVDSEGGVWVVDRGNDRVEHFSAAGEYLGQFGSTGSGNGELAGPTAITIDSSGNVWIADTGNDRIEGFSPTGEFLDSVGTHGTESGEFDSPRGIVADLAGHIWVADSGNGRLQEFNEAGEFIRVAGIAGFEESPLAEPEGLDIGPYGTVWVADTQADRVVVFSSTGEFVRQFGSPGSKTGQFASPETIDVDHKGNVWVADTLNRVQQFDEDGIYFGQFGASGSGAGQLDFSTIPGLASDGEDDLWVSDPGNHRVQRWTTAVAPLCHTREVSTKVDEPVVVEAGDFECRGDGPLEFELAAGPEHGDVGGFDAEKGTFTYSPTTGFDGSDSVEFVAKNSHGESSPQVITIQVGARLIAAYSFNEEEGLYAHDSAGHHTGILHGPHWTPSGFYGGALNFDGENDQVTIPASHELDFQKGFTLEAWVRPRALHGRPGPLLVRESSASPFYSYMLDVQNSSGFPSARLASDESEAEVTYPEILPTYEWSHVAVTSDGEQMKFYVDGSLVKTAPAVSLAEADGPLQLGGSEVLGDYFEGSIDEVRLYAEPRDEVEIGDYYVTQVGPPNRPHPIAAYSFDEGKGEIARDSAGAHDGSVEGATWTSEGKFGSALEFDGEDDQVTIPASGDLDLSEAFTLDAWVRPSEAHALSPVIAKEDSGEANPYGYVLYGEGESEAPAAYVAKDETTPTHLDGTTALPANTWSHLAVTSNGEQMHLYVNGELVQSGPAVPVKASDGALRIGGSELLGQHFAGRIDEVRIYDRVLGVEEIEEDRDSAILADYAVTIAGEPMAGERLVAIPGDWPSYGAPMNSRFQWERCDEGGGECEEVNGENRRSYLLGGEDIGHTLRVVMAAHGVPPAQPMANVRSAPTGVVTGWPPVAFGEPPRIDGHAAVGATVSVDPGGWSPSGLDLSYQWQRCEPGGKGCEALPGAEAQDYAIQALDQGSVLAVAVTGSTSSGSETVESEPSDVVAGPSLLATAAPSIEETASPLGEEMRADPGTWSGGTGARYSYQWQRCESEAGCVDIPEADGAVYWPGEEDAWRTLRVAVTARTENGRGYATSTPTPIIESALPANTVLPRLLGVAREGEILEGDGGSWTGFSPQHEEYVWLRCDAAGEECEAREEVENAALTDPELLLTEADVGSTIRLRVTTNSPYGPAVAESEPTAVIASVSGSSPELTSPPAISGVTEVGEELTASAGIWSGAVSYRYQWQRCDSGGQQCEPIEGAERADYVTGEEDVGAILRLEVIARSGNENRGFAFASTGQSIRQAGAPDNTVLPILEGVAKEGEALHASGGTWSGSGPISYAYAWQRCDTEGCVPIDGQSGASYTLTGDDVQHTVRVLVAAENSSGTTTAVSAASEPVGSLAPKDETAPSLAGGDRVGATLTVGKGTWGGEPTISYAYQWRRCDSAGAACVDIPGETGGSYELAVADSGGTVRALVTATNSHGETSAESSPSAPISDAGGPTASQSPAVTGVAEEGEFLSAEPGSWEEAEEFSYQWQRCEAGVGVQECANIVGATSIVYVPGPGDVGAALRVAVLAVGGGGDASAVSPMTDAVTPVLASGEDPHSVANVTSPGIEGSAVAGETLSAEPGTWRSYPAPTLAYQWRRCDAGGKHCANIEGATSPSYPLADADIGGTVRVAVTASNGSRSRVAVSAATAVVTQTAPAALSPPSIQGEYGAVVDDEILLAEPGGWAGGKLSFSYQWRLCDAEGKGCEDIAGAVERTYEAKSSEIGSTLRVVVSVENELGSDSATSAATAVLIASAPFNRSAPVVLGETLQDGILEADPGGWRSTGEPSFTFQWERCDEGGGECESIAGAEEQTYLATAADIGSTVRVEVEASNELGTAKATSGVSEVIGPPLLPSLGEELPWIEGFTSFGRELEARPGQWNGHQPINFSYQWQRCDESGEACENIVGATKSIYLIAGADLESRIRLKVTASNTSGSASEFTEPTVVIGDEAPSISQPPTISGGIQRPGFEFEATPGSWYGSGPLEFAYQWQRCDLFGSSCEDLEGEIGKTYLSTTADIRHLVRAVVTATGPLGSESASSEFSRVLPFPSENTASPAISGSAVVGSSLSANSGEWTPKPDEFAYQWQRCSASGTECASIPFEWASKYTLATADIGKTVRVRVTALNEGEEEGVSAVSEVSGTVNSSGPYNLALPVLSTTTPIVGTELSTTPGSWAGLPTLTYSYEWQECFSSNTSSCFSIPGATASDYVPSEEQIGERLRVRVQAENSNGSMQVASALTERVEEGVPPPAENLEPPSIEGEPVPGGLLHLQVGEWNGAQSWEFAWERCYMGSSCELIGGEREEGYVPREADISWEVRAVVTGVGRGGDRESVATELVSIFEATAPIIETPPQIEGVAEAGRRLDATNGQWFGSPYISYDYLWKRCDAEGHSCVPVGTGGSYAPRRADVGSTISLQVTATNGGGSSTASGGHTEVVPPFGPIESLEPPTRGWRTPEFGSEYSATPGSWAGDPATHYQWQRCDPLTAEPETEALECADIAGAEDPGDFVPRRADVGFELRLEEVGSAPGEEDITVYSEPSEAVADEVIEAESSYAGRLEPGEVITADSGIDSGASLPLSVNYRFTRIGDEGPEELQNGESPDYELVAEDVGHEIEIEMTVQIGRADEAETVATRHIYLITAEVEAAPTNDALPAVVGEATTGSTLTADSGEWHGGGGPLDFAFQWQRCDEEGSACADIGGATAASYVPGSEDLGSTLRVGVTAKSGSAEQSAKSEPTAVVSAAVVASNEEAPAISGDLVEFGSAEANAGEWTGTAPISYAYQWQGCATAAGQGCLDIEGATEPTLHLDMSETGEWLRVLVTATNPGGKETVASELVGPIASAPPPNPTRAPSLSVVGPPNAGSTLMTDGGSWDNVDRSGLEYQWLRCNSEGESCDEIEGATQATYLTGEEDVEATLEVEVTATNSSGRVSADSEPGPVIGAFSGAIGENIVFLGEGRQGLYAINGEGAGEEEEELLVTCEGLGGGDNCELVAPRISPDGKSIVVEVREREAPVGQGAVYVMNFDGSEAHAIGIGSEPSWSSDGAQVYYVQGGEEDAEEETQLVAVWADGSDPEEPELLGEIPAVAESAGVSSSGDTIVYSSWNPHTERSEIFVTRRGLGTTQLDLGPGISEGFSPRLSPDGTGIVFAGETEFDRVNLREERLYEVNLNGSNLHAITPDFSNKWGVEYGPVSFVGNDMLVSRQFSYGIIAFVGGGNGVHKFPAEVLRMHAEGSHARSLQVNGLEPDALTLAARPKLDCPSGVERCVPWNDEARELAGAYARKWSNKTAPKFNPSYWHIGSNCTNFVSQAWHKAGQVFMGEWSKTARMRWWADKNRETREEMNDANYNWENVNGFRDQQLNSKRARDMGRLLSPDWQEADAVLMNWRETSTERVLDHTVIVTESDQEGRFISSETEARNNIRWNDYYNKVVPEFFEKDNNALKYPEGWTWDVIRPTFKASNLE
ncbi:MAG TPA: LamG-like jellyroll fold domain-containing protein [Solirubrobacterales bacterium]|nr:LamG-like jellyroll fold domain-containing protein [Solirubrobacterales bacterium]